MSHDPDTLIYSFGPFDLWHNDPCRGGRGDDSCGWFKRAHHGDPAVLKKIVNLFSFDWDRTFTSDGTGKTYMCGLFMPDGHPALSVHAIAINLFFLAALEVFPARRNALRYLNSHLFEILFFAENQIDSLYDSITRKFGEGDSREDRIRKMASCIYGYILRDIQPWWQHPRWHVHHWRITCRWSELFKSRNRVKASTSHRARVYRVGDRRHLLLQLCRTRPIRAESRGSAFDADGRDGSRAGARQPALRAAG